MFTGIVVGTGTVAAVEPLEGGRRLAIDAPAAVTGGLEPGDSVAVDGACLTAVAVSDEGFRVEVIGTTLSRTIAGGYGPGSPVNLERPVRVGDHLDGHIVQGHVDGVGTLLRVEDAGEYRLLDFGMPEEVDRVTVLHGSITVNGVSLTVNALPEAGVCQVAVIPHTWKITNLRELEPGDPVNLEGDLIGKYVGRMLAPRMEER